jgi:hypothetical protein
VRSLGLKRVFFYRVETSGRDGLYNKIPRAEEVCGLYNPLRFVFVSDGDGGLVVVPCDSILFGKIILKCVGAKKSAG